MSLKKVNIYGNSLSFDSKRPLKKRYPLQKSPDILLHQIPFFRDIMGVAIGVFLAGQKPSF